MILAEQTRYGGGVRLWDDAWDLREAHRVIHHLTDEGNAGLRGMASDFTLGLAYAFRKAYERARREKTLVYFEDKKTIYGAEVLWPVILLQLMLLRRAAGFVIMGAAEHAVLYGLEAVVEGALREFHPEPDAVTDMVSRVHVSQAEAFGRVTGRVEYFASLRTKKERRDALIPVLKSLTFGYEKYWEHDREAIDPQVFEDVAVLEETFRW